MDISRIRFLIRCGCPDPFASARYFKKDTEAPDTRPMADASAESARIAGELGNRQLDESKRQFDQTTQFAKPVIDAELEMMRSAKAQGDDYYKYMVDSQRPIEQKLNAEAMAAGSDAEVEKAAGLAAADVRQGSTAAQNQLLRQGLRYGYSPEKLATVASGAAGQQGLAQATAMNSARTAEKATGFAKKMDVAGMYRGLAGASQGAYSLANASGNSAVNNQATPGLAYQQGMGAAAGTTLQGRSLLQQGLGATMGADMDMFATQSSNKASQRASNGQAAGTAIGLAAAYFI